ncbi:hypothetical protein ACOSQ2_027361 [Xanthoceras sorbifolium]
MPERFVFSSQPVLEEKTKNDAGNKTHGKWQRRYCEEPSIVMAGSDGSSCSRGCCVWSGCDGGGCNKGNIGRGNSGSFKEKLLGLANPSSWMYSGYMKSWMGDDGLVMMDWWIWAMKLYTSSSKNTQGRRLSSSSQMKKTPFVIERCSI